MKVQASVAALLLAITVTAITTVAGQAGPYKETRVTQADIDNALKKARAEKKFLMVEFGANWCVDCLALDQTLSQGDTKTYFEQHFVEFRVDVGRFDRNLDIGKALGVELNAIPTAVFFAPDGSRLGATNKMELEPSRKYGAKEILGFLKEIAERKAITNPAQFK